MFPLTWCSVLDICDGRIPDVNHLLVAAGGFGLFLTLTKTEMLTGLIGFAAFCTLAFISSGIWRKTLGGADVKLMASVILCSGIRASLSVIGAAFMAAGAVSVVIKAAAFFRKRRKESTKNPAPEKYGGGIPFAPFLLAGMIFYYYLWR